MKGIVFNYLEDFVEKALGDFVWDEIIVELGLTDESKLFVSPEMYPDADLLNIVVKICERANLEADDGVHMFGEFLIQAFKKDYPLFFEQAETAKQFLKMVDQVIHVEVKKIHYNATPPEFEYFGDEPFSLGMIYHSDRGLCSLAKGMIKGLAKLYSEKIVLEETMCTKKGHKNCTFLMTFEKDITHVN